MIANSLILNAWYAAGLSGQFPAGELQGRKIGGKPVVMWRAADGRVVAFDDRCVHKRMPLSAGRLLENGTLECAYHGLCYDTEGTCVKIPSQPEGPIPARAKLRPYPVIEQDGLVWIWPGKPEKIGNCQPPRTPEIVSDEWDTVSSDTLRVKANYRLVIENLLDITHFYRCTTAISATRRTAGSRSNSKRGSSTATTRSSRSGMRRTTRSRP